MALTLNIGSIQCGPDRIVMNVIAGRRSTEDTAPNPELLAVWAWIKEHGNNVPEDCMTGIQLPLNHWGVFRSIMNMLRSRKFLELTEIGWDSVHGQLFSLILGDQIASSPQD